MLEHTAAHTCGGAVRELQNLTTWEFACNPTHNNNKGPSGCGALPRARPVGQGHLLGAQHLSGCGATTSGLLHLTRALPRAPAVCLTSPGHIPEKGTRATERVNLSEAYRSQRKAACSVPPALLSWRCCLK